jgi:hypothetical protein
MTESGGDTTSAETPPTQVFLSYRRDDTGVEAGGQAPGLYFALSNRFGDENVFYDLDTLARTFDEYTPKIRQRLESCQVLVVLIGKNWFQAADEHGNRRLDNPKDLHRYEIELALDHGLKVIPVLTPGAKMPPESELPGALVRLPGLQAHVLTAERFAQDVRELVTKVQEAREDLDRERQKKRDDDLRAKREQEHQFLVSKVRELAEHGDFLAARGVAAGLGAGALQVETLAEVARIAGKAKLVDEVEATLEAARQAAARILDEHELSDARAAIAAEEARLNAVLDQADAAREESVRELASAVRGQADDGDLDAAREKLEEARAAAEEIRSEDRRAAAVAVVDEAAATIEEHDDAGREGRVQELAATARKHVDDGDFDAARATLAEARAAAGEIRNAERRQRALAELDGLAATIAEREDDAREAKVEELLAQALQADQAKQARAKLRAAREAADEIADAGRRARALERIKQGEALREGAKRGAFEAAEVIDGGAGSARRDNREAEREPGEPEHALKTGGSSVWYRWTAPAAGRATFDTQGSDFDTLLAVYRGDSLSQLEEVASNDDIEPGVTQSRVSFPAQEGVEYRIAVDGYNAGKGSVVLNWELVEAGENDLFSSAQELTGESGTVRGDTTGATKEPAEPDHAGNSGGASVWYRWTSPADGVATFDTSGSEFDTLLAVYRGESLSQLQEVASNDDVEAGLRHSRVTFPAAEGDEYVIAVDGYSGQSGPLVLTWESYATGDNDHFSAATSITGATGSIQGSNAGATKEPGEPDHAGDAGGHSVWYRWTAPASGTAWFDTFGSEFDTLLAVYCGSRVSSLDHVAANDDAGGSRQSRVRFRAAAGSEYMVAVDGYARNTGAIVLNWNSWEHKSLVECLDDAGLHYTPQGGGVLRLPFAGERAATVYVDAKESADGLALFKVDLPEFTGFWGKAKFLQNLLKLSYSADYAKGIALSENDFALAIEVPATAQTPSVCAGLLRSLAALGDVTVGDLGDTNAWNRRLEECKNVLITVFAEQARTEMHALLERAGLSWLPGLYVLDVGGDTRQLALNVTSRVISLQVPLEGTNPGGDRARLTRLLQLNLEANVAKVGMQPNGDLILLYEVPQAVPDAVEWAVPQLRELHARVRAAI